MEEKTTLKCPYLRCAGRDTFIADSVEDAKKQVEGMLLDHWKEQIVYLEDCIDLLQNKEEQENGKEKIMKWEYESII